MESKPQGKSLVDKYVRGMCNFLSSVSLQQKFEATGESVLELSFIGKQRKIGVRADQPKRRKERIPRLNFGISFYMFFLLPGSCPM